MVCRNLSAYADAPRAGSAEAKGDVLCRRSAPMRCTPCRQRRGKALPFCPNTPRPGCTPCRQRRGKEKSLAGATKGCPMHPVQAAPRQRQSSPMVKAVPSDAPRAGSAEAKPPQYIGDCTEDDDAPRAGSAEAKILITVGCSPLLAMHPVQAAPRQRGRVVHRPSARRDAPRAGSAEAKR